MKRKYMIYSAFAVLALSAFVTLFNFGTLKQVSAEEFTKNFTARTADKFTEAESGIYTFDKNHSAIGFRVKHMGLVDVPGYFTDFTGTVNYNAEDITKSSVEFTAKTASVNTRVEPRDKHLRSDDFFDVEKFPEMTFKSTKVAKSGDNNLLVTGDFTLRGVKKSITLPVMLAGFADGRGGSKVMGATAETMIDRSEYGVNYGIEGGGIGKDVKVTLNIEAIKPPAK